MAIIASLRVSGNPTDLERYAAGPGGGVMQRVSAAGKAAGAVRHTFAGNDNEVLVIDEWPDEQSFQEFFDDAGPHAGCRPGVGARSRRRRYRAPQRSARPRPRGSRR